MSISEQIQTSSVIRTPFLNKPIYSHATNHSDRTSYCFNFTNAYVLQR